ncbi:MAG: DUF2993 domain-containing protein [Cryobacterium sp.]
MTLQTDAPREPRRGKKRPGRRAGLIIFGVLILLLVGAYFIVDAGARAFAQGQAEKQIAESLPDSVTGDVSVAIGGTSVIAQFIAGSFEQIELDAPNLLVDGVPAAVHVTASRVPTNTAVTIGNVEATLDFTPAALNALLAKTSTVPPAELTLGDGDASYSGTINVAGFSVGYVATVQATAAGDTIVFTPTTTELTTDVGTLDVSGVVDFVLDSQNSLGACIAEYLPEGVDATGVDVTPERARITLESSTLTPGSQSLTTLGTCAN